MGFIVKADDKYHMPQLSLYRTEKSNDYRFFDRTIAEQLRAGATDLYIHKYLGPTDQGPSVDATQPQYDQLDPKNIQDLMFLENRDRTYSPDIVRIRGHYNVQNLDFDLSQFGLFLNNDILFITVHLNSMIELLGRKLIVGDVIELPHLADYHPLNEAIPVSLRRYYQVTDGNNASEGFSPTWYPHLWRIKCEPLVDSQEFSQILSAPVAQDNFLGTWDKLQTYPAGYTVTFGDTNYVAARDVPAGVAPGTSTIYWTVDTNQNLKDILSTYNKNIAINDSVLAEAKRLLPKSGYDTSGLYVVPTHDDGSPANPVDLVTERVIGTVGTVVMMRSSKYKKASPVIRMSPAAAQSIWDMTADGGFVHLSLEAMPLAGEVSDTGSGSLEPDWVIGVQALGSIIGPYGTADNTYARADQDPTATGFTGTVNADMDFRADCDPRFQFIARSTPRSFGYTVGYMTGDGTAPNGLPTGAGITFPQNPVIGAYFLRTDYAPQLLFRWSGTTWVRISSNVRTDTGFESSNASLLSGFINNTATTAATDGSTMPQRQGLSTLLALTPDILPRK
jgi:hypothetical protein